MKYFKGILDIVLVCIIAVLLSRIIGAEKNETLIMQREIDQAYKVLRESVEPKFGGYSVSEFKGE